MSIVQNPLIGRTKKQAGGMVFTTLNGQNVMKSKPASYRDANTTVQQNNRSFHKSIVLLAASLAPIARSLFEKQPTTMTAYSRILQQLHAMRTGNSGSYVFSPIDAFIGSGSADMPITSAIYTTGTGNLELTFSQPDGSYGFTGNEAVQFALINKSTLSVIAYGDSGSTVTDGELTIVLPTGLTASQLCVFIYATIGSGADLVKTIKKITQVTAD